MKDERLTMTVEECAQLLGIGRQLAYSKANSGELPAIRVGRRLLISRAALQRMLEQCGPDHENIGNG